MKMGFLKLSVAIVSNVLVFVPIGYGVYKKEFIMVAAMFCVYIGSFMKATWYTWEGKSEEAMVDEKDTK